MSKLVMGFDSLKQMESGVDKLVNAVKLTLGPKGRNVALEREYMPPLVTNDGVTIANTIVLDDSGEKIGADIVKEASIKTNDEAGDGTTTACVLSQKLFSEGIKNYTAGANPVILKNGIKKASEVVTMTLKEMSTSVKSDLEIYQVATVSAGDSQIGKIISDAYSKIGLTGVITVEEGKSLSTTLKIVEGMQFDKGYISPYMATNMDKMIAELNNAYILVTDKKISTLPEILPILEKISSIGTPLLIIAEDIEQEVLNTLVLNKLRGNINVVAVKAPAYADKRTAMLSDIATLTNATFISNDFGQTINGITLDNLGRAEHIVVSKDSTTISGGSGDKNKISERIDQIKSQIKLCDNDFDKSKLLERLAKLTGGVAVISVGSATEIEMQEKKLRIEDAISATKSAIEEGIVPGGGIALINCTKQLKKYIKTLSGDEKTGAKIVLDCLSSPLLTICDNAGVNGQVVLNKILSRKNQNYGYDALNNAYVNMFKCGIIDPTKVTRCALTSAISVACSMLSCECLVTLPPKQATK